MIAATFLEYLVFFAAALMILGGALGVILFRHPVHAALGLVLTLFGVAVQFVAQEAHFLAAVQVIVYAGAIVVLFLFVIMLLGVYDISVDLSIEPIPIQRPLAAVMSVGLVALLAAAIVRWSDGARLVPRGELAVAGENAGHDGNIEQLARSLYGDHVFAFQLTSVLLIVAVVATVLLTRKWPKAAADAPADDTVGAS
jgi:NADH-quinone oxidoreductase subunit J